MLILGALIGVGSIATGDATSAMFALVAGGFLFVSGAVFAGAAAIQDTLKRRF